MVFEVDGEQYDQRAPEQHTRREQRTGAVIPPREREHDRGERLDNRILRTDGGPARPTPAAERDKADNRHVLVPRQRTLALGTRRGRPHDRLPQGQAVDTDVEKAANGGAKCGGYRRRHGEWQRVAHDAGAASRRRGSSGGGNSGDEGDNRTRPSG